MTEPVNPTPLPSAPPVPQRNDSATFDDRVDDGYRYIFEDFPPALETLSDQTYQNAVAASEAASQAVPAAATAVSARDTTLDYRDSAWAAAAAAQTSAGLPEPLVPGRVLGATGLDTVGWIEATAPGDIIKSVRSLAAPTYLPCDGRAYLRSAYPKIASLLPRPISLTEKTVGSATWYTVATDGAGTWVAASTDGWIALSIDNGATWSTQQVGIGTTYQDWNNVAYANGVWVTVGSSGRVAHSTNGGASWSAQQVASGVLSVLATDGNGVWISASGGAGDLIRSADNGSSWSVITVGGSSAFRGVATDGSGVWIAVGGNGNKIARSVDNGASWTIIDSSSGAQSLDFVSYGGDGVWVAGGNYGQVHVSTDNGATWVRSQLGDNASTSTWRRAASDGNGNWVMVGASTGVIAYSRDDGATWGQVLSSATYSDVMTTGDGLWVITGSGPIMVSVNNGASWSGRDLGASALNAIGFDGNSTFMFPRSGKISVGTLDPDYLLTPMMTTNDYIFTGEAA